MTYRSTAETLRLLAEAKSLLGLLMDPLYFDEAPTHVMIADLHARIARHLLASVGHDELCKLSATAEAEHFDAFLQGKVTGRPSPTSFAVEIDRPPCPLRHTLIARWSLVFTSGRRLGAYGEIVDAALLSPTSLALEFDPGTFDVAPDVGDKVLISP